MDDLGVNMSCIDLRNRTDLCMIHDNGITLHMGMAPVISYRLRMEHLLGISFADRSGHNPCGAVLAVQLHVHIGHCGLSFVCHKLLCYKKLCIIGKLDIILALRRIYSFDLCRLKRKHGVLADIDLCHRVEHFLPRPVSFCIMIFHIFDIRILSHMECMNPVVARLAASLSMDSASGNDRYVSAVFNIKIIVYDINAFLGHYDRYMHLLVLCLAADMDIDSGLILFLHYINMTAVAMAHCHSVQSEVICPFLLKTIGIDNLQNILRHFIQLDLIRLFHLIRLHRVHLPFVFCTRRNPAPDRKVSA